MCNETRPSSQDPLGLSLHLCHTHPTCPERVLTIVAIVWPEQWVEPGLKMPQWLHDMRAADDATDTKQRPANTFDSCLLATETITHPMLVTYHASSTGQFLEEHCHARRHQEQLRTCFRTSGGSSPRDGLGWLTQVSRRRHPVPASRSYDHQRCYGCAVRTPQSLEAPRGVRLETEHSAALCCDKRLPAFRILGVVTVWGHLSR